MAATHAIQRGRSRVITPQDTPTHHPQARPPSPPRATPEPRITGWHVTAAMVTFLIVLALLIGTVIVGMRVSWVPLRDTAVDIGLAEVRHWYPLAIDGLDGVAIIAAIALYGRPGYAAALGTVIGISALSTLLNVAHGTAAAGVTAESDSTTWIHATAASAAPNATIALGAHLVAILCQRLRGIVDTWLAQRATLASQNAQVESSRAQVEPEAANPVAAAEQTPPNNPDVDTHEQAHGASAEPEARPPSHLAPVERNLVTAKQAAGLIGVHRATVDTWVRDGSLPVAAENEMGWRLYDAAAVRSLARAASN